MKRIVFRLLLAVACAYALCGFAGEADAGKEPDQAKSIVLATFGHSDTGMTRRVATYVARECGVPVHVLPHRMKIAATLAKQQDVLTSMLKGENLCMVALMDVPGETNFVESVSLTNRIALINAAMLKTEGDDARSSEVYGRRLEKRAMNAVGSMLGLPPCPNPRCAMSPHRTFRELDAHGRNYCPPCQFRTQQSLIAKGVDLSKSRSLLTPPAGTPKSPLAPPAKE